MSYSVKEIFYTLQGEGANTGRAAVFCRFTGCNLWSGRGHERASAICKFCDTDFVGVDGIGGGKFVDSDSLAGAVRNTWPDPSADSPRPLVVCTGGEPLLQLDDALVVGFHNAGFEIAVETNGTKIPPNGIDWICVSPKAGAELRLRSGNELKFIYPQTGITPQEFELLDFEHFFLQPLDGPDLLRNTRLAVDFCLANPRWRLSLQTHKILGIP